VNGVFRLAVRRLQHDPWQALILAVCIAVALALPLTTGSVVDRYQAELTTRADATPLIAGAIGNRFDLTLACLYFHQREVETVPASLADEIQASGLGVAIPLHVRFTARGYPLVGTVPEYYELRGLRAAVGSLPLEAGEVVLGSGVAVELDLGPGDHLFSDQVELYDISVPPSLKMRVCGVLAPTGGPDDGAVFVDLVTAWVVEGIAHGHDDVTQGVDPAQILAQTDEAIVLSGAFIEYNEITPDNAGSIHLHADRPELPLSGIIVNPLDQKSATILASRLNARRVHQMLVPRAVVDDLLAVVFRIKRLVDVLALLLGASTILLSILVIVLSLRARTREIETLHRIGCPRFAVVRLCTAEIGLVILTACAGAAAVAWVGRTLLAEFLFRIL
jgi:putative ABC transport system permease protein